MRLKSMLAGLGLTLAMGVPIAAAQDMFPGWVAGAASDATMAAGRRFDCTGASCPSDGLACLHAVAPKGEGRIVPTSDLLRPRGMPWKDIEGWMSTKLARLDPRLASDPRVKPGAWTVTEAAHLSDDKTYVAKRYTAGALSVPMALWMEQGAMNVLVCKTASGAEDVAGRSVGELVKGLM